MNTMVYDYDGDQTFVPSLLQSNIGDEINTITQDDWCSWDNVDLIDGFLPQVDMYDGGDQMNMDDMSSSINLEDVELMLNRGRLTSIDE